MTCDRIYVFENGKIEDFGSHEELSARCEVYREFIFPRPADSAGCKVEVS